MYFCQRIVCLNTYIMNSKERLFAITMAPYEKNESLIIGGGIINPSFDTGEQLIGSAVYNSCEVVSFYNGKTIARWGGYALLAINASK